MAVERRVGWFPGFLAVLRYELLWSIRKKKVIGLFILAFAIATLFLVLPPILSQVLGSTLQANPSYALDSSTTLSGFFLFLFAVAVSMNSISGEFETGTITPLLTKPVSRTTVFLAKAFAAFLTLLGAFSILAVYNTIGGAVVYGPQDNLGLVPLGVIGLTVGTLVWVAIVIFLGTLSKNSLVAALGSFGVFLGLSIVGAVLATFLGQSWLLFYTPGDGPLGSTRSCELGGIGFGGDTFSTGTNSLGLLLAQWATNPNLLLNFCGLRVRIGTGAPETFLLSSQPISSVLMRALGVSIAYIVVFLAISWFSFKREQIME